LQNRLIQTSQTGGQWYSDTSPLVFSDSVHHHLVSWNLVTRDSVTVSYITSLADITERSNLCFT
jgi:hypothetical protein